MQHTLRILRIAPHSNIVILRTVGHEPTPSALTHHRSGTIVIPIEAIILNLLSVAAAYGGIVLVFQHGWGKGLLGFEQTGGIVGFLPIFLFVILFGLSMDYHVLILSRIREAYGRGMSTEAAVAHGIKTSAGVVTSAAIVMVGVFSIFATLQFMFLKQFGVGLTIAVVLDATMSARCCYRHR
jgi:uncharacterized membrane protein YdfJ with MMPL/SSD domain